MVVVKIDAGSELRRTTSLQRGRKLKTNPISSQTAIADQKDPAKDRPVSSSGLLRAVIICFYYTSAVLALIYLLHCNSRNNWMGRSGWVPPTAGLHRRR